MTLEVADMRADDPQPMPLGDDGRAVRHKVVDADAHIEPPHAMWKDYLPERFRDAAPKVIEGEEFDQIEFEGNVRPVRMISNQAGREGKDYKVFGKISDMRAAWVPETRLADMDLDGMDAAVLFGGGPLPTRDPELYIASFEAYNRWLWDFCGAARNRLVPVGYVPMRDVDETIGMLRDLAKMGFRTVNIPAFPQARSVLASSIEIKAVNQAQGLALTGDAGGDRAYTDAEFDRLWETLQDLDMSITMHLGGRVPRFGDKKHFLPDLVMSKLAMAEPVAIMIYGAIFQRFPKLQLGIIESGVGWLSWMAEYMDRTWQRQRYWVESPLDNLPSHYMDTNVFASFIHDRDGILRRERPGGRNIMWSSDYPHSETTFPNSHKVIARDFAGIPEADVREITCERARRFYRIG